MEANYILRQEHEEFVRRMEIEHKRMDDENKRQNERIKLLEGAVNQMNALTVSVERMAVNMENMLAAIERQGNLIERQGERLDDIEREPAENGKQIKMAIITTIASALVSAVVAGILTIL